MDKSLVRDRHSIHVCGRNGCSLFSAHISLNQKSELRGVSIERNQYPVGIHKGITQSISQLIFSCMCVQASVLHPLGEGRHGGEGTASVKTLFSDEEDAQLEISQIYLLPHPSSTS